MNQPMVLHNPIPPAVMHQALVSCEKPFAAKESRWPRPIFWSASIGVIIGFAALFSVLFLPFSIGGMFSLGLGAMALFEQRLVGFRSGVLGYSVPGDALPHGVVAAGFRAHVSDARVAA